MATTEKMSYDAAADAWMRGCDNVWAWQKDAKDALRDEAAYLVTRAAIIWAHIKHTGWTEEELEAECVRRLDIYLAKRPVIEDK